MMATYKLYYDDPFLYRCKAKVIDENFMEFYHE